MASACPVEASVTAASHIVKPGGRILIVAACDEGPGAPEFCDMIKRHPNDKKFLDATQDLVTGLNRLGVSPRDTITILQAIKAAGALQAEITTM